LLYLVRAIGNEIIVFHLEIDLVRKEGPHQSGYVIIGYRFTEDKLRKILVCENLVLLIGEFPEIMNGNLLHVIRSPLFYFLQFHEQFLPRPGDIQGSG